MSWSISRNARIRALGTAAGAVLLPAVPALACPVCVGTSSRNVLLTYFITAAAMTLTALGSVAGITAWLYWRFRQAAAPPHEGER
jgi:hypothetical protein